MTQFFVFETLTGDVLAEFTPATAKWTSRLNEAESLDVTIPLDDPGAGRDWFNLGTPWRHCLLVEESGRLYGGPIQPHNAIPGEPLKLSARGFRCLLDRRSVLPSLALTTPLVLTTGEPNSDMNTTLSGLDLGSIGMRLVQQATDWPGSGYPIDFEPARAGTRTRTYEAVDLKRIDEALTQLSGVENGPDFDFRLRWVDPETKTRVRWQMVSGTEEQPRLQTPDVIVLETAAARTFGSDVTVKTNPSAMGSLSWASAGRGDDEVLIARAYDPYLIGLGFPLLELFDSSHSSVEQQDTLDGYARASLATARKPSDFWSFRISLHEKGSPRLADITVGDRCVVIVSGDAYIPDGQYNRRIVAMSGDEHGLWVDITCGEDFEK